MKILIVTKNWLGDVLFQLPALEAIKGFYPDAEIVCLAPSRCREILEAHPAVSRVLVFDERREQRSFWAKLRFVLLLRREKWDQAYLFHRSRTRAFLVWLAGAKERIGYGARRRLFLTRPIGEPRRPLHQMDYFLELLARAGIPRPENPVCRFYFSAEHAQEAGRLLSRHGLIPEDILSPFVCFHVGANWEPKRWPPSHFASLAEGIALRWGLPIVLTGSSSDRALGEQVIREVSQANVISVIGETSLGVLGALYARAVFVVSADSGPLHIAAGVATPLVGLFGPTDPRLTGPRGAGESIILTFVPEGLAAPWYGDKLPPAGWMSRMEPAEVLAAIEKKNWVLPPVGQERQGAGDRILSFPRPPEDACPPDGRRGSVRSLAEIRHLLRQRTHPSVFWRSGGKTFGDDIGVCRLPVKSVLLMTLSNIGDVILTTPALMALRSQFPQARLTVVTGPRAQGLLQASRFIDRLVIYNKEASLGAQWRFLTEIRREAYDWVVDLRNTAIPFLVKARRRSPLWRRNAPRSMREKHLEVLRAMGVSADAIPPFDFFHAEDEASLLRKLKIKGIPSERGWILVAPAAASGLKTWRLAGFRGVIESLLRQRPEDILLVGERRERALVEPLARLNPSRVINVAGETTLPELAVLVSRSSLVLTNDSAVMHLGFEMDRPVVGIFGPTHHEKYGRRGPHFRIVREPVFCSPCERSTCRFERQACFEDLSAEKVYAACRELLEESSVNLQRT